MKSLHIILVHDNVEVQWLLTIVLLQNVSSYMLLPTPISENLIQGDVQHNMLLHAKVAANTGCCWLITPQNPEFYLISIHNIDS